MNGMVRKELGEMLVCKILWLVWMKEHNLEQVIKRFHFKVWALRKNKGTQNPKSVEEEG